MLPTFFVIGAPKCATTSLHHYLKQHPDIFMSPVKEPHFFLPEPTWRSWCGPEDQISVRPYLPDQEAYERQFDDARPDQQRGESSVFYYLYPEIIPKIQAAVPDAKVVVMLRDPVERAYSNYMHLRRDGREPERTFEAALADEERRLQSGWRPFWGFIQCGMYAKHLAPWKQAFGDRMQIVIVEEFQKTPQATLTKLFRFLGVADHPIDASIPFNRSGEVRSRRLRRWLLSKRPAMGLTKLLLPERVRRRLKHRLLQANLAKQDMDPETRQRLQATFAQDIAALEEMLGRRIDAWHRA